jgi:hypothetical protein
MTLKVLRQALDGWLHARFVKGSPEVRKLRGGPDDHSQQRKVFRLAHQIEIVSRQGFQIFPKIIRLVQAPEVSPRLRF